VVTVDATSGGHRHLSELALWSHRQAVAPSAGGLDELVQLAVRAAVLVPRSEVRQWFAWAVSDALVDELVEDRRLSEPKPGWLTVMQ